MTEHLNTITDCLLQILMEMKEINRKLDELQEREHECGAI